MKKESWGHLQQIVLIQSAAVGERWVKPSDASDICHKYEYKDGPVNLKIEPYFISLDDPHTMENGVQRTVFPVTIKDLL